MKFWTIIGGIVIVGIAAIIYEIIKSSRKGQKPETYKTDILTKNDLLSWYQSNSKPGEGRKFLCYITENEVSKDASIDAKEMIQMLKKETGIFKEQSDVIVQVVCTDDAKVTRYRIIQFSSIEDNLKEMLEKGDFFRKQIFEIA